MAVLQAGWSQVTSPDPLALLGHGENMRAPHLSKPVYKYL